MLRHPGDGLDRVPNAALAAEFARNRQRQQAAFADQFTLVRRVATSLVALDGGGGELLGQALGQGQRIGSAYRLADGRVVIVGKSR